jgi:sulfoxide reductase heme-binding subunit YedZ
MSKTPARPWVQSRWLAWLVISACMIPAAWGVYALVSDLTRGTILLSAEPIKELEHFYGDWILRFLIVTLLVTPIRKVSGANWLQKYRRRFGLIAFTYAALHLLVYVFLDVQLDWATLGEDLSKRWYIIVGMSAFLILLTLAITSTTGWVKRLGKRWVKLHKLVYLAVILGTLHYWMSVKRDIRLPATYALIFAVLLGYRAWITSRTRSQRPDSKHSPNASSAPTA